LKPTYETLGKDAEVVWQKPAGAVKGVLLVFHGCSHSATDWWPKSAACPKCIGLPEEVNITRVALHRGYALVALSSAARNSHKCWHASAPLHHPQDTKDVANAKAIVSTLLPREGLDKVPLYGMGASSGGAFVLVAAMGSVKFAALCSQIMAAPEQLLGDYLAHCEGAAKAKAEGKPHTAQAGLEGDTKREYHPFPPTLFVHMPRDGYTATLVRENVQTLKDKGVAAKEIAVSATPLTPTYLAETCRPEISVEQSQAIFEEFKAKGLIDAKGELTQDPRAANWRDVITQSKTIPGNLHIRMQPDASGISEELNLLWAGHEIISTTTHDMLDWFESVATAAAGAASGGSKASAGAAAGGR